MNTLHRKILAKSKRYRSWHHHPDHKLWHWAGFLAIALVAFVAVSAAINKYAKVAGTHFFKALHSNGTW